MARAKHKRHRRPYVVSQKLLALLLFAIVGLIGIGHLVFAKSDPVETPVIMAGEDPNFHVRSIATQFFEDNDAAEMIPVIECESHFRHYEPDGTPLVNREGSSAIGVAQILTSQHPDPKIIARYDRRFDMDLTPGDFDLTTLGGNLGYALVLYKVRGTRDWECGKKFSF